MINFYQNLPLHIDPIAFSIGSFSVRWYALSYLIGFAVFYFVLLWRIKHDDPKKIAQIFNFQPALPAGRFSISNKKDGLLTSGQVQNTKKTSELEIRNTTFDLLLVAFFSALIGGRVGYFLFYDFAGFFSNPLAVFSPYDKSGFFVGFFGMSYHGALLGVLLGSLLFLRKRKIDFFFWADFIVPAVALGYFFGRIGNFLNGELYGRITNSFWGMYFASDPGFLRHPSQIYEAVFEGLLLFLVLWKMRSSSWLNKFEKGGLFAAYLIGYGFFRSVIEFFRQPDAQIGFFWGWITLGQILSLTMVLGGLLILILKKKKTCYTDDVLKEVCDK